MRVCSRMRSPTRFRRCGARSQRGRPSAVHSDAGTRSAEETEGLGERLAASLTPHDVVYLRGELGSGKTTLARGIARGLGALEREVPSPTFALLHEYAGADGTIVLRHLDLYRLRDDSGELAALGLPDAIA